MTITLVAAISKNNCIGKNGEIPWYIPEDFKRMREITQNKVLIMGRNTWESIPKHRRPLPKRTNIVITRNESYELPEGVERYSSIKDAVAAHPDEDIVSFGGQGIYKEMIEYADVLEITHVEQTVDTCDAFFPDINMSIWKEVWRENHEMFSFVTYERI
jgi:dihydrofolate reductase